MIRHFIAAAALLSATTTLAQAPTSPSAAPVDPATLFGVRESVEQIDISPDGQHLVFLQPGPGRTSIVYLADVGADATPRVVVRSDGSPERLRRCNFVTNDRLICQVSGMATVEGQLTPFSRLVAIDADGRNVALLGQHASYYDARVRQFDGSVLDWLTAADGAVLMARDNIPEEGRLGTHMARTADGLSVDRIDVRTTHTSQIEPPVRNATSYLTDGHGHVRIMTMRTIRHGDTDQLGTQSVYMYRTESSRDWQRFSTWDAAGGTGMIPIAVDPALNAAYVLQKLNGRMALYRVKLDGSLASELVYANEHVDVDDVVTANRGTRVIGVTFAEEQRRIVYFDQDYATLARRLSHAIPNLPLIDFGGTSADGNRIIVHAGSDSDAGRYYVFDRAAGSLNEIMLVRPQLENVATAQVRSISYPAADGTQIPAYLTLPPGGAGRNLPAIVLPHGGPDARDEWGFDWLAQYFAHLGYAVLQPNYRGSAGYGDQWLADNGFRSWRISIGDITAGAHWLAAQGIADRNRMAVIGWSYGGYAALQSGVTEPGLFRAIVAIAPVTDLQEAKDDMRGYTSGENQADYIGTGPHLTEGSPLRNVAAITAPVLLFHGDRDLNVNVLQSRRMDEALHGAGKTSTLTVFPGLEHDLADTVARVQMLQRIAAFLTASLPAGSAAPAVAAAH